MKNSLEFRLWGREALFTDPLTKVGGERCSYHVPTYEALKGIVKSIYWRPTLVWYIDKVRVVKRIRTQTKGTKLRVYHSNSNDLAIYNYLVDVEYQVAAHFEWNVFRPELEQDRIDGKHYAIAQRMLERGGRQDVFLGTRDCQAYVEPCPFGTGESYYDDSGELSYGLMFHSFGYPDETGLEDLQSRFWNPMMCDGVIVFPRPEECNIVRRLRPMKAKRFDESNMSFCNEGVEVDVLD